MVDFLRPNHRQMLTESAISDDVIAERGYQSVTVKSKLKELGFGDFQCGVPTLVIPIHSFFGGIALYHHRPDQPRFDAKRGRLVKYEFPKNQKMALDVHPRVRGLVRDPKVPLFITEGIKKADAAISMGLCCIGIVGVWNFRGTNEFGGKTALPDWEGIALKGANDEPRLVFICYDSDAMLKKEVHARFAPPVRIPEAARRTGLLHLSAARRGRLEDGVGRLPCRRTWRR